MSKLVDGNKLIIAPTLPDVEGAGIFPDDRLFLADNIDKFDLIVILIMVLKPF